MDGSSALPQAAVSARPCGAQGMFISAHVGFGWSPRARTSRLSRPTPQTAPGALPLLVCDVWEHAYYLDHKNDRASILAAWWDQLVDWAFVADQYDAARSHATAWRHPSPDDPAGSRLASGLPGLLRRQSG
jgi:hypothetical protein